MKTALGEPPKTLSGLIFSFVFWVTLVVLSGYWLTAAGLVSTPRYLLMGNPEGNTFDRMHKIIQAQQAYFQISADLLDQNQFAQFFAHLWITPDPQGKPLSVNLISKRMALAMGRENSLDGYFFVDIHQRDDKGQRIAIDCQRGWAIAALPRDMDRSGFALFLADESNTVYVKQVRTVPDVFPARPGEAGWHSVRSKEKLEAYLRGEKK